MLDPVLRQQIEAARVASFPDPAAAVALLFEAAGETMHPEAPLVEEADAWWMGYVEIPIDRVCKGIEVSPEAREIASWADEWWDELRRII